MKTHKCKRCGERTEHAKTMIGWYCHHCELLMLGYPAGEYPHSHACRQCAGDLRSFSQIIADYRHMPDPMPGFHEPVPTPVENEKCTTDRVAKWGRELL